MPVATAPRPNRLKKSLRVDPEPFSAFAFRPLMDSILPELPSCCRDQWPLLAYSSRYQLGLQGIHGFMVHFPVSRREHQLLQRGPRWGCGSLVPHFTSFCAFEWFFCPPALLRSLDDLSKIACVRAPR